MKYVIVSPDANGNVDPSIQKGLLDFLPGRVTSEAEADVVIVPVAYMANFRFNEELYHIGKKIVILDYVEFGWSAGDQPNLLGGFVTKNFGHLASDDWERLEGWITDRQPALTFKRELFERDRSERLLPIEWPCRLPIPPVQSREEFDARPIEVFFQWGYSHPSRPRLHGAIFKAMASEGINVLDSFEQWADGLRNWATIYTPHYLRRPIEKVMALQQSAKISVSLPGAGVKCFRHSEAPVGSIMALPYDDLAWSHPWIHGENCLRLSSFWLFPDLESATHRTDLYDIYLAGIENVDKYASVRYCNEYIMPAIENAISTK